MKVVFETEDIGTSLPYPVIAIGNFDGLHRGHQAILKTTIERATQNKGTSIVLTFSPHPTSLVSPRSPTVLLSSFENKIRFLESFGIHVVLCMTFNREFSAQPPAQFVESFLVRKIGCKEVIVGENFAFGKDRSGNVSALIRLGQEFGFHVEVQPTIFLEERVISSSEIRRLLRQGNVRQASEMLARPYTVKGKVVYGDGMGKKLGVPTANIFPGDALLPGPGIYASRVRLFETPVFFDSVSYIRSAPTASAQTPLEVHLFDYNGNLYGRELEVAFLEWIRSDKTFANNKALIQQICQDIKKAQAVLRQIPLPKNGAIENGEGRSSSS